MRRERTSSYPTMSRAILDRSVNGPVIVGIVVIVAASLCPPGAEAQPFGDWEPAESVDPGGSHQVNTPALEGCPIEAPDGRTLFFASNRDGGHGEIDIWIAQRESLLDPWSDPENLPEPVNSGFNDFCPTPLPGGRLLFVSNRGSGCGDGADIYETRLHPVQGWLEPVNLGCDVNSAGNEFSPSLVEEDGLTILFFSSDRDGSQNIYMSVRQPTGEWGAAVLIDELSSPFDDARPNVRKDGLEIVFDSTRAGGEPAIWTASRSSLSAPWSEPEPLGPNVTSEAAESRASISRDGRRLYFGSTRDEGEGSSDIYVATRSGPPLLTQVDPAEGDAGDTVTVVGEGFEDEAAVHVCGEEVVPFSASETALEFILPPCLDGGAQSVSVINPDGESETLAEAFTYGWSFRYDFAEGATGVFTTGLGLFNPDATETVNVEVTLLTESGAPVVLPIELEPLTREHVDVNAAVGTAAGAAAVVRSDRPIAPTREMHWDASVVGSTLESGAMGPSTVHYFAEGGTVIWDLFHLLANDTDTDAQAAIQYLRQDAPPVSHAVTVPAHSRQTVWANAVPGMEGALAGAIITSDVPIAAERAMYLSGAGQPWIAGASSRGAHQLDTTWHFAEGATTFFDTFLLLMNSDPTTAAQVEVVYSLPDGQTLTKDHVVAPNQRLTIFVSAEDPALADTAVAMIVTSDLPIMAERTMWWGPTAVSWYEAHTTLGSTETGTVWAVGEAWSGGPAAEDAFVLISNATAAAGTVRVTLVYDDGTREERELALAGSARETVHVGSAFPLSSGRRFSVLVESLGGESAAPIMVEVSRYQSTDDIFGNAGGSTTATKIQ
jgi:Tol biopolymer transport system component